MKIAKTQNKIAARTLLLVALFAVCCIFIFDHSSNLFHLAAPEKKAEIHLDLVQLNAIYLVALVILSFLTYYRFKSALTPFFNDVLPSPKRRHLVLCLFQE